MSIFDRRKKEGNLPEPGEGGGSDEQLGVAADAVSEADAEKNPYTPPFPVPLTRQIVRKAGDRGIAEPPWIVNPPAALPGYGTIVGIGGTADQDTDAPVNTVRVDNLTRQWMYFPDVQVWVPPLWVGRVFRYNGSHRRKVLFETPAGMTAYALSTSEVAAITFYEEVLPEVDGEQLSSAVISGLLGEVAISGDAGLAQTQAYSADSLSQTLLGLIVNARLQAWDGVSSDVDRLKTSSPTGASTSASGILAAAAMIYSAADASYQPMWSARGLGDANVGASFPGAGLLAWNGAWDRVRTAKVFKTFGPLAIAASSSAVVWTPAAGLKPRLMGFLVNQTSVSAIDGMVTFYDNTTTGAVLAATGWLNAPGLGLASEVHSIRLDNGPLCATSSNVIRAWSSNALNIAGMIFGTEE